MVDVASNRVCVFGEPVNSSAFNEECLQPEAEAHGSFASQGEKDTQCAFAAGAGRCGKGSRQDAKRG